ncbi:MAG: hypothetical protein JOZ65_03620 [Chloroflexi bacterium]|nr:hypothetical protein [Chloroflexota bacterium]
MRTWLTVAIVLAAAGCAPALPSQPAATPAPQQTLALPARIVAVGIPGAAAVSPVGTFHPGGPIHDTPDFAAYTQPGRILDPERILVTSSSNFGAPKARDDQPEGAVLSIDAHASQPLVIPSSFATAGGQATALDGRVQLFTAQSPAFLNKLTKPAAVTADQPAVANPRGISINNAFGRLWFPNIPTGLQGYGTESIVDPDGRPLANAPDDTAGGVFAAALTNRNDQKVSGALATGAVGNALLGRSPDGSTKAVFAVVTADGALLQAHAAQGIDGLAPAGAVHPIASNGPSRAGMLFNWTPDRMLLVAEPSTNSIAVVPLTDDGAVFHSQSVTHLSAPELQTPVDLTPAVPEVANPDFSSNTTLAGGSDLYVANAGNGHIVRMRQDGKVVAVRSIQVPGAGELAADRVQGIAISADATRLWITVSGSLPGYPNADGGLLEVPAFGAS